MMEKQQQQHTQESPRVVDIVENCVRELSEKLAACEAHLVSLLLAPHSPRSLAVFLTCVVHSIGENPHINGGRR